MPRLYLLLCVFTLTLSQTTPDIEQSFFGRCEYFKEFGYAQPMPVVCSTAWNPFFGAFAHKDPCNVTMANYASFFNVTGQVPPRDMTMLWSGTQDLKSIFCMDGINCYDNSQFMPSYVVGEMNWCGSTSDPSGMNFTGCKSYDPVTCPNHVTYSFWAAASEQLALRSTGRVRLLLNGTRTTGDAYSRNSFFAKFELPNLNPNAVTLVEAIVALTPGQTAKETCNNGSLVTLRTDVTNRGLNYQCTMNPPLVRHASCGFYARQPASCNFRNPLDAKKPTTKHRRPAAYDRIYMQQDDSI
ncbi:ADP-ribosyl cyclase/cyclic ADP-ribose hydrolase-like [Oscarella lobularis]|uniref:ADP-ribosyl cyclase/cyclic ADP-ribose hydrolase-like n=1 Tax=Oscarella lobularis TaxID=121494 RepID=UPI003313B15E